MSDTGQTQEAERSTGKLREMHKKVTIDLVRRTAKEIFSSRDYRSVSMGELARAAGISRTTLYAYFPTKGDILFSFLSDVLAAQLQVYQGLAELRKLDTTSIEAWLHAFRDTYDEHRNTIPLFHEAFRENPSLDLQVQIHRDQAIAILGRRYPVFDFELGSKTQKADRHARAYLMVLTIELVGTSFAIGGTSPELSPGITLVGKALLQFLTEGTITY